MPPIIFPRDGLSFIQDGQSPEWTDGLSNNSLQIPDLQGNGSKQGDNESRQVYVRNTWRVLSLIKSYRVKFVFLGAKAKKPEWEFDE